MSDYLHTSHPRKFTLPIEIHVDIPCLRGLWNGKPILFVFDSGAQGLVLNSRYVDADQRTEGEGVMGVSGKTSSCYTPLGALTFGEWKLEVPEVIAIDMEHLEDEFKVRIDGIIGFRQLVGVDWMVDYAAKEIHFWDRFDRSSPNIVAKLRNSYRNHLPCFDATIAGNSYKLLLDTGASELIFDETKREQILAEVTGLVSEEMASSSPIKIQVESGTLSDFQVAGLNCGPCTIKFSDLSLMKERFGDFDGIVGFPLLSKYRTVVSWDSRGFWFLGGEV